MTITTPGAVAVDQESGNVFLTNGTGSNNVAIFGATGGNPIGLQPPYAIPGFNFANEPSGIAIDNVPTSPAKGTLYVSDTRNKKVKKFQRNSSTELYEPSGELTATPAFGEVLGVAVGPSGEVWIADFTNKALVKFSPTGTELQRVDVSASFASGRPSGVAVDSGGDLFVQGFTNPRVVKKWTANESGQVEPSTVPIEVPSSTGATGVAIDRSANALYVIFETKVVQYNASTLAKEGEFGSGKLTLARRAAINEQSGHIYLADNGAGKKSVAVFGPAVLLAEAKIFSATDVETAKVTFNGAVNPGGVALTECVFEYGTSLSYGSSVACDESVPADSSFHPVSATVSGLIPETTYFYRLKVTNVNGSSEPTIGKSVLTSGTVNSNGASVITSNSAFLSGAVNPAGSSVTECRFEYLSASAFEANGNGYSGPNAPKAKGCSPSAPLIEPNYQFQQVGASVTELEQGTTYHFRLSVTKGDGTKVSADRTFTTLGKPNIEEEIPLWVESDSATLRAEINPNGLASNYRVEWGTTPAYGRQVPVDVEPSIGAGTSNEPIIVKLANLEPGTRYHYRVVATNSAGASIGEDHQFQTLNECGLIEDRCFEQVSPALKGPVGVAGESVVISADLVSQAAPGGSLVAYQVGYGLPDSSTGAEMVYRGERDPTGWLAEQISAKSIAPSVSAGPNALSARTLAMTESLDCSIQASNQPLTADAPPATLERQNLFRRDKDGAYSVVTPLSPSNASTAGSANLYVAGVSDDCSRVVFATTLKYQGLQSTNDVVHAYEWEDGAIRSISSVPGPSGEQVASNVFIGLNTASAFNAVSPDASRVFFTATRQASALPAEIGKRAVFVRENGTVSRDLSRSESPTIPSMGAFFQMASEDGNQVFFLSNSGLSLDGGNAGPSTCTESGAGCDLYRYDLTTNELRDLTLTSDPANVSGAGVRAVIGASTDGKSVYFAALGQLVAGKGQTFAENTASATTSYNVYLSDDGELSFVGLLRGEQDITKAGMKGSTSDAGVPKSSRVTSSGNHLLFESSADISGYLSGVPEAYLYSAKEERTVCVSCRRDNQPSVALESSLPLVGGGGNPLSPPASLSDDGGRVFFYKADRLAVGAQEYTPRTSLLSVNLYEWHEGQITTIATEIPEVTNGETPLKFLGASSDGRDLYFFSQRALVAQDQDERADVYDARVGGGFAPPSPDPAPCDPLTEGNCQEFGGLPPAAVTPPASATMFGGGNEQSSSEKKAPKQQKKKKKKKKKKDSKKPSTKRSVRGASK